LDVIENAKNDTENDSVSLTGFISRSKLVKTLSAYGDPFDDQELLGTFSVKN